MGFYSAFLVADRVCIWIKVMMTWYFILSFYLAAYICIFLYGLKVVVSTKSPRSDKQYVWEGEVNASSYTISEETDQGKLIPRGTRLTLHLKVCQNFLF